MLLEKKNTQYQKAYNFLKAVIKKFESSTNKGQRLVSCSKLARHIGVSSATIWRVLDSMRKEGLVDGDHRNGFYIKSACQSDSPASNSTFSYSLAHVLASSQLNREKIKLAILNDWLNGRYGFVTALPSLKQMCRLYNTSFQTLKKALIALQNEGYIQPFKKTYKFVAFAPSQFRSRFLLLARRNYFGELFLNHQRGEEFCRTLQRECLARNLWFDTAAYDYIKNNYTIIEEKISKQSYIGYVVTRFYNEDGENHHLFYSFIHSLGLSGLPVVVVDDGPIPQSVNSFSSHIKILTFAFSPVPGMRAAQYLFALGHRNIAYFSAFHGSQWSRNRLYGLKWVAKQAGLHNAIHSFVDPNTLNVWSIPSDRFFSAIDATTTRQLNKLMERFERQASGVYAKIAPVIKANFELKRNELIEKSILQPLFEEALTNKNITAWVCANDQQAFYAIEFLQQKGVKIPQQISVMGFDDSHLAFEKEITSVNFNIERAAYRSINFVCAPRTFAKFSKSMVEEIAADVIERKTTTEVNNKI